ncbi:hypothetical protein ACFPYI_20030 [Halomarina salina]|uniref:Uncharacterized protein n=1 Tax=Halomarina salina TaxID=1872699 RepID=A0ABD5RSR0_9EURY|nr:hypothetical protein [Halomarina salina]
MSVIGVLSGSTGAVTTVGLVLGEALVLYVGYGVLDGLVRSRVLDAAGGE